MAAAGMSVTEEWRESLKKLEELPKSKAQLKAEAKAEMERLKAEAKAEKERERLRRRGEKDAEMEERLAAHKREVQERKEAEERRRAEEEMRKAEERAEQSRRKAEKEAQESMKRAEEMADVESRKAAKKAAVLAAVAATQAGKVEPVAAESVAALAQEVANSEKEAAARRKQEKELKKAAARLAKEEKKRNKKGGSKWLLWLLLFLLLVVFAGAAYYLFFRGHGGGSAKAPEAAAAPSGKHLDVPAVGALTYNPDMIPYTDREIGRNRDMVCVNMAEYINNFLAERDYRSARVPMMDCVRQYADERMQQLLGPRFAVQRFIPYEDYIYDNAEPWLKRTYADVVRHMVQSELMNRSALDDLLDGVIEELGLQSVDDQPRTAAEVQQVKATEQQQQQPAAPRKPKVQTDKDAPVYVYVEKESKQGFDIVAGFYLNKSTAAKMTARLHELGCDAYIIEKNDMFYVSMGSAPTRTKAEALYNHIKSWYDGDIVIKEL